MTSLVAHDATLQVDSEQPVHNTKVSDIGGGRGTRSMKWFLTKHPVGSQDLLGFGKALDQIPLAFDNTLLLAWSFSLKFTISTQRLIRGS